jgi:hypothetical protein
MIVGAVLKIIGYAICITGNRSTQNTAPLAVSQILLGASALTALGSRVGAMASVPHEDMASLIAAYFFHRPINFTQSFFGCIRQFFAHKVQHPPRPNGRGNSIPSGSPKISPQKISSNEGS